MRPVRLCLVLCKSFDVEIVKLEITVVTIIVPPRTLRLLLRRLVKLLINVESSISSNSRCSIAREDLAVFPSSKV
ncbi:hypothetical protein HG530_012351 [Fusarium avenaceum]|nr:hypothetical protein HG530_012351 [Fusarium avenaceum]